jgi:predicted transposase YdaD
MAKRKRKEPTQEQQQPYDNLLESLLEGREQRLLPYFLATVEYLETLDLEVHRTTLRVDRVYKVLYRGRIYILHIEFESGSDNDMSERLLEYHVYFYRKYKQPVISIIVYPFQTKMAESPLREMGGDEEILVFHFRVFPLWKLSAEQFLHEHIVLIYSLLPTMQGANARLLHQAIDEMIEYYRDNPGQLGQEFKWMGIVLRRADTVPLEDKREIEVRLNMYDDLIEQDPKMKKMRAESEAKGRAEGEVKGKAEGEVKGKAEGEAKGLQDALVTVVEERFPPLAEFAQKKVTRITKPDALKLLLKGITAAPNEEAARLLLELLAA